MKIKVLKHSFSICKVNDLNQINLTDKYCFIAKTDEEISVICSTRHAPQETCARSDGWRAFRLEGPLDLSLVGILSGITQLLEEHKIPLIAVGTYTTDYILVKKENLEQTLLLLEDQDYKIIRPE